MRRWYMILPLVIPLFLAGCSVIPSTSGSSAPATPAPAMVATQVAMDVQATIAARSPTTDPPPGVPTATPFRGGAGPTPQGGAPTPTITVAPTGTSTTLPSATPAPSASRTNTPTVIPTPVILSPIHLAEQEIGGGKLLPRYWTNTPAIVFSLGAPSGTAPATRPEVEVEPLSRAFTGTPTGVGSPLQPGLPGSVTIAVSKLPEGPYHWQARLSDGNGHTGPWVDYYNGPAFRLDRTPPDAPVISSTTHPNQKATYSAAVARMKWAKPSDNGGIQGYLTAVDRNPNGIPTGALTAVNATVIGPLANGTIYFHVRAEDWAGNLGKTATYVLHIDHRAPSLGTVVFDRYDFNPRFDHLTMHFIPSARVTVRVEIRQQNDNGLVRIMHEGTVAGGSTTKISWDGRDQRGVLVQPGYYTMIVLLTDKLGNVGDGYYGRLGVNYRLIVVHLATQSLNVYNGTQLLQTTLVTTGNALLPTPMGIWHVVAKYHPYKFISPWKKGTLYYYAPSDVNYALNFHSGGYFIHDAPWRTVYGPGTNTAPGPPGVYSGTHGCVNVPTPFAAWLYKWAAYGTVVQVEQ
ncbi:MAG TPA: L,D-transpeptidase family protein [Chloroflexota bacterium]|nr:L,D-transpeptidase family protein [Chloroflexota bacterium]